MKFYLPILILFIMYSCSDPNELKNLHDKVLQLEKELDECKFGEERLFQSIKNAYENNQIEKLKILYDTLEIKHPHSDLIKQARVLVDDAIRKDEKIQAAYIEQQKRLEENKLQSLKKLKQNNDDVTGINWYKNPYFIHYNNTNLLSIYFGKEKSSIWLRLKISYEGSDWIFFESAYLSYDGNTEQIHFDEYRDKKTEVGNGSVWEWIDVLLDKEKINYLREFSQSPNAKMRLSGKYTKTRNISLNERKAIADILNGYEALQSIN